MGAIDTRWSYRDSLHGNGQSLDSAAFSTVAEPPDREDADSKEARKRHKQDRELRRDAERRPDAWERFRILIDAVKEARQVVEIADHKARYALVVGGAVNAAVYTVLARAHLVETVPPAVKPWLIGALILYAALTVWFVAHALDCLRPRTLDRVIRGSRVPAPGGRGAVSTALHSPLGLLVWEMIVRHDPPELQAAWERARMAQINAELVAISHTLAGLIQAKYRALRRLYAGLAALAAVSAGILGLCAYFTL